MTILYYIIIAYYILSRIENRIQSARKTKLQIIKRRKGTSITPTLQDKELSLQSQGLGVTYVIFFRVREKSWPSFNTSSSLYNNSYCYSARYTRANSLMDVFYFSTSSRVNPFFFLTIDQKITWNTWEK